MLSINSPFDTQLLFAAFIKNKRKQLRWSRDALAQRSTVPAPTIKKFETTGQISLRQLLLLWQCVDHLDTLATMIANQQEQQPTTIEEVLGYKRSKP